MNIWGLITALITPFKNNNIDIEGLKQNIRFQIENSVDGIVVLGTTGEAPTLSAEERRIVIKTAVEEAKGKIAIIVGTGTNATQNSIAATEEAEVLGADCALVMTPYYNRPTQEGIFLHFSEINKNSNIPILIYNIPVRCGQNIDISTIEKIADLNNVIGIKEASGNMPQIINLLSTLCKNDNFKLFCGDDILSFPILSMGGTGIISVTSNLVPSHVVDMMQAFELSNFVHAKQLYYELLPLFKALTIETNPIPIKTAMSLYNMPSGRCRLPLCNMHPENIKKLEKVVWNYKPCYR